MGLKSIINHALKILPDRIYISLAYFRRMKILPDLKHPKRYTEKQQWLKLYDHNPVYSELVDKYEVRKYVANTIGEEHLIKLVGGPWECFEEINFDALPQKFVLKCTHDSGGLVICKDKNNLDLTSARKKIENSLGVNYYWNGREWPYKNVKPRIIAEQYMEDTVTKELRDYKFFCFSGKAKLLFIATERQSVNVETKFDFFDMDFNHLDLRNGHPNADVLPEKPVSFIEMQHLAEKLSTGFPHVRVDFYEVDGKVYFGELTFFHWSGTMPFEPDEWDYTIGSWIKLPIDN